MYKPVRHLVACLQVIGVTIACLTAPDRTARADQPNRVTADFTRDVQPILAEHCYRCHGPEKQDGGIRWDRKSSALAGGDSGEAAVMPGHPDRSELIRRLTTDDADERMPPADEGKSLSQQQVATITRWIEQGADWLDAAEKIHWAYVAPQRPELPKVANGGWPRNAIDRFILACLEKEDLRPSPPADPARLMRRVYLDLIGLPPSVEEVDAFLKDPSPQAYEKVVDRLLASERFGEKWARRWLDLARYSDSNGYQADQIREMWAYRDWVIDALNADMPFDQFTMEQIAGDLLPSAMVAQKIATGFHRTPTCNVEAGVDPEENRTNQVIDRVNTTGTVWLGTTLECAQCHNHKYDPFTQKDYYQLFAFFNNTPLEVTNRGSGVSFDFYGPKMDVPLSADKAARQAELQRRHEELSAELQSANTAAESQQPEWERRLTEIDDQPLAVHAMDIAEFVSAGDCSHEVLPDKSALVGGSWPSNDTYTVTVHTELTGITGFKLEALTDPSLEENGPGRGDKPNFVLNEVTVTARPRKAKPSEASELSLQGATADFSQAKWDVKGAFDGDLSTGWAIAPQFGKPHFATVQTAQPIGFEGGTTLVFELVQNWGRTRTIGRLRLSALTGGAAGDDMTADLVAILNTPVERRDKKATQKLRDYYLDQQPKIKQLRAEIEKLKKQMDGVKPPTTLVMVEMDQPRMTNIFKRGDFLDKGLPVEADVPPALHPLPTDAPRNRIALAEWLVSSDNPLVARVTVNRWWEEIFGRGIVRTSEDFGTQGDRPSHPELLDWLAVEFMDGGWSMKAVLKLMVTSATYQQSARVTPELLERDFNNALLARGPRFRLPAESIRDNTLQIAGLLSTKMYGPPVYPPQPPGLWNQTGRNEPKYVAATDENRFRRGVYVVWRRAAPYPSFINFDAPDRMRCVVERPRTNTPLQALTLMNDDAYVEAAQALAARIMTERPEADVRERLEYAVRLCAARQPRLAELDFLETTYRAELKNFQTDPNAARALVGAFKLPSGKVTPQSLDEWASWTCVANILLNLDETITK